MHSFLASLFKQWNRQLRAHITFSSWVPCKIYALYVRSNWTLLGFSWVFFLWLLLPKHKSPMQRIPFWGLHAAFSGLKWWIKIIACKILTQETLNYPSLGQTASDGWAIPFGLFGPSLLNSYLSCEYLAQVRWVLQKFTFDELSGLSMHLHHGSS